MRTAIVTAENKTSTVFKYYHKTESSFHDTTVFLQGISALIIN